MVLMDDDVVLGEWILNDPEHAKEELTEFLAELRIVDIRDRVWLRVISVPLLLRTMEETRTRRQEDRFLEHICGIVSAVSCVTGHVYARQLQCVYCGETRWKWEMNDRTDNSVCCFEQSRAPRYDEHQQSRLMISTQKLKLDVLCLRGKSDMIQRPPSVWLKEAAEICVYDDLAGRFKPGDVVVVFAMMQHVPAMPSKAGACRFGHPTRLKVNCNSVELISSPWALYGPLVGSMLGESEASHLEFVCKTMQRALPHIHPPTLLIASLLSGVMIGSQGKSANRDQIHILLTCHGRECHALVMLHNISTLLSPINNFRDDPMRDGSVCTVARGSKVESMGTIEVSAQQLVLSRMGISILDWNRMSKTERKRIIDYLSIDVYRPAQRPEFAFPVTSTVWATLHSAPQTRGMENPSEKVNDLGKESYDIFDVVIPFSVPYDPLYDQSTIQRFVRTDKADQGEVDAARHQIRCVMKRAVQSGAPKLPKASKSLLQRYYTYVRNPRDFGERMHSRSVPIHVFQSLLRLAGASAKLTLSPVIRPVPDVTLAIKLMEETLLEVGVFPHPSQLLLNMDGISHQCVYPSLDSELSAVHEMLQKTLDIRNMDCEE